jgi:hypothetical protein
MVDNSIPTRLMRFVPHRILRAGRSRHRLSPCAGDQNPRTAPAAVGNDPKQPGQRAS